MALAKHCNNDVQHQIRMGMIPTDLPLVLGRFVEKEYGYSFEYAERRWPDDNYYPELCHIVYVGFQNETRLAKVLKTVAYILTEHGIQKWDLKENRIYETEWVYA